VASTSALLAIFQELTSRAKIIYSCAQFGHIRCSAVKVTVTRDQNAPPAWCAFSATRTMNSCLRGARGISSTIMTTASIRKTFPWLVEPTSSKKTQRLSRMIIPKEAGGTVPLHCACAIDDDGEMTKQQRIQQKFQVVIILGNYSVLQCNQSCIIEFFPRPCAFAASRKCNGTTSHVQVYPHCPGTNAMR